MFLKIGIFNLQYSISWSPLHLLLLVWAVGPMNAAGGVVLIPWWLLGCSTQSYSICMKSCVVHFSQNNAPEQVIKFPGNCSSTARLPATNNPWPGQRSLTQGTRPPKGSLTAAQTCSQTWKLCLCSAVPASRTKRGMRERHLAMERRTTF